MSGTHGKGQNHVSNMSAEFCTRQKILGNNSAGKQNFAECPFTGMSAYLLPSVSRRYSVQKSRSRPSLGKRTSTICRVLVTDTRQNRRTRTWRVAPPVRWGTPLCRVLLYAECQMHLCCPSASAVYRVPECLARQHYPSASTGFAECLARQHSANTVVRAAPV